mgnify:CR=1 FL=1
MIAELTKSDVLFETLAMTSYPPFAPPQSRWPTCLAPSNVSRTLAQRPAVGDFPPAISTTGVTLSLLLLTAQVLPQRAALRFVCVNMRVKRLMAHGQLAGYLHSSPLQPQKLSGLLFQPGYKRAGIAAQFIAFTGKYKRSLSFIASCGWSKLHFVLESNIVPIIYRKRI